VREARRDEEGDASLQQIVGVRAQLPRDPARRLREVVVRKYAVSGDDGETVGQGGSFYDLC